MIVKDKEIHKKKKKVTVNLKRKEDKDVKDLIKYQLIIPYQMIIPCDKLDN